MSANDPGGPVECVVRRVLAEIEKGTSIYGNESTVTADISVSDIRILCNAAREVEELRKNAERYRWLRERVGVDHNGPYICISNLNTDATDEAIDAAQLLTPS